jgi:A/G-specific adenine glycosylase
MEELNFTNNLISWFKVTPREMPWNETKDPYLIWLSEIILQQTRVQQGLPYYEKFVSAFPNVQSMAKASEEDVLSLWKGLGYYSRARNMYLTAKVICEKYDGKFPSEYKELLNLKGIGTYTAAAIASFAFGQKYAVVDGNVKRVLARHFLVESEIGKSETHKKLTELADSLIDTKDPASFNRAIMNLGALICAPRNPDCKNCPIRKTCLAYEQEKQHELPFKAVKKNRKKRYFHFFIWKRKDSYLLQKRTAGDIWKHLYQFPLIDNETDQDISFSELSNIMPFSGLDKSEIKIASVTRSIQHLTHQTIIGRFYLMQSDNIPEEFLKNGTFASRQALGQLPFPKIIDAYLEENMRNVQSN